MVVLLLVVIVLILLFGAGAVKQGMSNVAEIGCGGLVLLVLVGMVSSHLGEKAGTIALWVVFGAIFLSVCALAKR